MPSLTSFSALYLRATASMTSFCFAPGMLLLISAKFAFTYDAYPFVPFPASFLGTGLIWTSLLRQVPQVCLFGSTLFECRLNSTPQSSLLHCQIYLYSIW